jgi:hypothetical protein
MVQIGDLISFSYPAIHQQGTRAHDKQPHVLILHPSWINVSRTGPKPYLHGLNFNYLSNDEINLIRMMIDTGFQLKYYGAMQKKNPALLAEFDAIIGKAGAATITSPHDFYLKVIKPFIRARGWDPYRLYDPQKMTGIKILQPQKIMIGEQKRWTFGTDDPRRGTGQSEAEIVKRLAEKEAAEEEHVGHEDYLTPAEQRFIQRLAGSAKALFEKYKKQFQYAKGPRMGGMSFGSKPPWAKFGDEP